MGPIWFYSFLNLNITYLFMTTETGIHLNCTITSVLAQSFVGLISIMVRLTFVIMIRIVKIINLLLLKSVYIKATISIYLYQKHFLTIRKTLYTKYYYTRGQWKFLSLFLWGYYSQNFYVYFWHFLDLLHL
jgi:hypothetical protein